MQIRAYQKNAKISPKKVRFLLESVRSMTPEQAADALYYMPNASARILRAVIKSALANATNAFKIDTRLLQFKTLSVDQGNKLKRYRAGGRGTAKPYARKLSHITVVLETVKQAPVVQKSAEAPKEPAPQKQESDEAKKPAPKAPARRAATAAPRKATKKGSK